MRPEVHKFGGVALSSASAIRHAASIVARRHGHRLVVVASAMDGVTDALLEMVALAGRGDHDAVERAFDALRHRHLETAAGLGVSTAALEALARVVGREFDELATVVRYLASTPAACGPAAVDLVAARGEVLSARLLASTLCAAGVDAEYVGAECVVHASGRHGDAVPDFERTVCAVRERLVPLLRRRVVPVVPGYVGRGPDGATVTLGRGGSDLTATLLGRALDAPTVTLWKDVPGVLTADPRVVPEARLIPRLPAREAAELAYYGARVLHPRALVGLGDRTRLHIRPLADPAARGTVISARRDHTAAVRQPVRAISAIGAQAIVTIRGAGTVSVSDLSVRAFGILQETGTPVALVSQGSSDQSICLAVPTGAAAAAEAALRQAFAGQLERGEVERIGVRHGVAVLAVVGPGMTGTVGVAARLLEAISRTGTSVLAIAQGASELNISVVIDERDAAAVQRAVHGAFQLGKIGGGAAEDTGWADVVILGYGRIGRELASQLGTVARNGPHGVRVVATIDSSGYAFEPGGMSALRIAALTRDKEAGIPLAEVTRGVRATAQEALAALGRHALSRPILVDVTAGDTGPVLEAALHDGMDIVLANKLPLASPCGVDGGLARSAASRGRRVLHEATVGAGLPIIDTILKLQESGDEVLSIEGCPSGTLGYLFGELGRGASFSVALRAAVALGYTEPDPREDLSGMDVARKALILGRLVGFEGELDGVEVESLVPEGLRRVDGAEFMERLKELDSLWGGRVERARAAGTVLRYRATVSPGRVHVGLVGVTLDSPSATLTGTDNQYAITTRRYGSNPIVITGPGAGVAVTAAGVLNDVLKLAGSRR